MATCGSSVVKLILMIINFILLVLGLGLTYVGFKLIGFDPNTFKLSDVDFKTTSYVLLAIGILVLVIAAFGFFGACCESSMMLNSFGFLLVILIIAEVYIVYKSIQNQGNVVDDIKKGIQNAINEVETKPETAKILQQLQSKLKCCGWDGPQDYKGFQVLSSCCDQYNSDNPQGMCPKSEAKYGGCNDKFAVLGQFFGSSTGLGIALIMLELILIFAACCLARDF